jgi:glycine/D-amino acid oxidase-like deaminating enzyme
MSETSRLSVWERESLTRFDFLVVGGGLIGLSTALDLRELVPAASVAVLERGVVPSGASTRNAGFACFGSLTELLSDLHKMGPERTLQQVQRRLRGLAILRERVGAEAMDMRMFGNFEVLEEEQLPALARLGEMNAFLASEFEGAQVFSTLASREAALLGFGARAKAIVVNRFEGELDSGKMMRELQRLAAARGVALISGAHVSRVLPGGDGSAAVAEVRDTVGLSGDGSDGESTPLRFHAERGVALCNNAAIAQLATSLPVVPGRGQMLLTAPIEGGVPFRGCFHAHEGYFYFRELRGRVLIGGGRNLDVKGEQTPSLRTSPRISGALESMLRDLVLPGRTFAVEQRWAGTMGFLVDKQPVARELAPRVVAAFGCNGMGVAQGPFVARQAAKLLSALR